MDWANTKLPEPEDFPESSTAPGLRALDNALRCTICKELFSGPVSLRCGHSFCSQCIRQALSAKQECPTCRKGHETEVQIRVNMDLEEAVLAWTAARSHVLELIEKANSASSTRHPPLPPKKRKRSEPVEDDEIVELSSETSPPRSSPPADATLCPMCNKPASEAEINRHLDSGCPAAVQPSNKKGSSSKDEWSKLMSGRTKSLAKGKGRATDSDDEPSPLPKVSYDTLKDRQIKELLSEQGLPTTGDRQLLIKRHQQWVIMYNSNLDKKVTVRTTQAKLKADLARWLEKHAMSAKPVVEDVQAHQRKYGKEFAALTASARPKAKA
ncbi:hypothetical protein CYLTODRAFT_491794 [Cylindrobasidium torrendii FP15055 ss-10]|uniref:Postreplication repair E3 ubiquitin-protein ligase RAD18 n=1 Tax=Cylindrobasidium torrendii FP15055 ss-10 TaxID=1314674 RepID=A0A0D7B749_9AGAR|nr:hypothetical protein CYLTODRAFT_491794 [Cylindrobasidium torrendii FP15055 ss-10]